MSSSCHQRRKIFLLPLMLPTCSPLSEGLCRGFLPKLVSVCPASAESMRGEKHRPSWPFAAPPRRTARWASSSPRSHAQSCHSAPTSSHLSGPATQESSVLNCCSILNQPLSKCGPWRLHNPFRRPARS